ncbi:MAG TPA: tripartite tricarboxylate transporter substrate binding protein BugD, partial [Pseudorhizobium sp.]|nr:tripartite tricarboxylate transporter substrate binding protein BugD [Pseudorhizobium sp.]
MKTLNAIIGATALAAATLFSAVAGAQTYPDRTITMVVP